METATYTVNAIVPSIIVDRHMRRVCPSGG